MLGLGWTEMLVIGVVALIVIGPKDLPMVMNRVGKVVGQIRRMGSDFQRELNRSTGLDEVRNLRNSITSPLKKTSDEIRREFNAMTPMGPKPSGLLKPADPNAESVVDEIHAAAGLAPPASPEKSAPVKAAVSPARRAVVTKPSAPTATNSPQDVAEAKPKAPRKAAAKPRAPKADAIAEAEAVVAAPARKKRTPAKPKPVQGE
jgi:sec-independent protein translocase protein TatB